MSGAVRIRLAEPGDAGLLAAIGVETFVETFGHLYSAENLAAFLESNHSLAVYRTILADPAYRAWIAEDERGADIGYAAAGPCGLPVDAMPAASGELKRVYVRKSAQGSGLGRRLIDEVLGWLKQAGYAPVYLSVYSENHGAQRLYARYGFSKIKEYEFLVGAHRDPEFIFMRPE